VEIYSLFEQLFLFKGLAFNELNDKFNIVNSALTVEYDNDEIIHSSEAETKGIGIIISGCAMINTSAQTNSPTLRKLSVGDTFGAASLFNKVKDYSTKVISDGRTSVAYINEDTVRNLCIAIPQISINYIEFLSNRVAFLNSKVSTFSTQSTDSRIAYYLYTLVEGEEKKAILPFTYSLLAETLGIGRASLYRSLDALCEKNIIKRDNRSITVLSTNELKKYFN